METECKEKGTKLQKGHSRAKVKIPRGLKRTAGLGSRLSPRPRSCLDNSRGG